MVYNDYVGLLAVLGCFYSPNLIPGLCTQCYLKPNRLELPNKLRKRLTPARRFFFCTKH